VGDIPPLSVRLSGESAINGATCRTVGRDLINLTRGVHVLVQILDDGYDIRTVQELLGHKDVRTTMIYTHVLNRGGKGVRSPIDKL